MVMEGNPPQHNDPQQGGISLRDLDTESLPWVLEKEPCLKVHPAVSEKAQFIELKHAPFVRQLAELSPN